MLSWFTEKESLDLKVDVHSHLLPGIDDGVKTYDEAIEILGFFEKLGYVKVVTTPHVHPHFYPNSSESITERLAILQEKLKATSLKIAVEAAAEYFVDHQFLDALHREERLLYFGNRFVLIETAFSGKPLIFDEVIFKLKTNGFTPVLAHPERYEYLMDDLSWLKQMKEKGVLMQLSLPSLVGAYGTAPKKMAKRLLNEKLVDFIGSDIHRSRQIDGLDKALNLKIKPQKVLNNELI